MCFDGFDHLGDPVLVEALSAAKSFCADMASGDRPARWISLLGPSGTGKTMLARAISRFFSRFLDALPDERSDINERWLRRGGFKRWSSIIGDMQAGDFSGLATVKTDWFLVLDDIGTERQKSDFAVTKLYEILNSRETLFTVITCNLPIELIGELMDTRIASRLTRNNSLLVPVDTLDYNQRLKDPKR